MERIAGVILAAGKGTRMGDEGGSDIPKVMFEISEEPMIHYSVNNVKGAGVSNVVVVVGYKKEMVIDFLQGGVEYAVQEEQMGTGHAVMAAKDKLEGRAESILICYGDMPLFKPSTIKKIINEYESQKPTIAMLSVEFDDPEYWAYGRIIRNDEGEVVASVEQKDCSDEQLKIKECNPCFYIFDGEWLWHNLDQLRTENAQKEYYLTDMIGIARNQGKKIIAIAAAEEYEALGINTPDQLRRAEKILKEHKEEYGYI